MKSTRRRASHRADNPRFDRSLHRSGRMPVTLIDASTRAGIATGLQTLAASFHAMRPCYAQQLERIAQAVTDSKTEAQQIAAYTTLPAINTDIATAAIATTAIDTPTHTTRPITDPTYNMAP